MKVSVKMNRGSIRALSKAQQLAAKMVAEQMLHEIVTEAVIPFDTGNLQNVATHIDNSKISQGLVQIAHDAPYAARLYFHPEYNFQQIINRNAKGEWWDDWLRGGKKSRPKKLYKTFYKKITGGIVK